MREIKSTDELVQDYLTEKFPGYSVYVQGLLVKVVNKEHKVVEFTIEAPWVKELSEEYKEALLPCVINPITQHFNDLPNQEK
jgi:hypothetical protein